MIAGPSTTIKSVGKINISTASKRSLPNDKSIMKLIDLVMQHIAKVNDATSALVRGSQPVFH